MNFTDHLRQFFGDEVADDELKNFAVHAIAADVRRLKPAISQAVWDSRQQAGLEGGGDHAVARLNEARQLHVMYTAALGEFELITEENFPVGAVAGHDESSESIGRTEDDSDSTPEHS